MLTDSRFWFGVVAGIGGLWVWHAFVRPVPTKKSGNS